MQTNHEHWMQEALIEAMEGAAHGEVPVGAVAVVENQVIARAHNLREATNNPLGHAELLLLQRISSELGSWRLNEVAIYVTAEPCLMCAGAMLQARIPRVVYGCKEPKFGACGSLYDVANDPRMNHRIEVIGGILETECAAQLKGFFLRIRNADLIRRDSGSQ